MDGSEARTYSYDELNDIVYDVDWDAAEDAWPHIEYDDQAEYLRQDYWTTYKGDDRWPQRVILAYMLQGDTLVGDEPDKIMLDVLRAPIYEPGSQDLIEWTKIVALSFIDERYDTFQVFYDDRALLRRTVDEVLRERGMAVSPPPEPPPTAEPVGQAPDEPIAALAWAAERGDVEAVTSLLDGGLDIDCLVPDPVFGQRGESITPLVLAALEGHRTLADALIERGADANASRSAGQTVLWWAVRRGWHATVEALLNHGAHPGTPDRHGRTPVSLAVAEGHLDIVRLLVAAGAELEPRGQLMHKAVHHNRIEVAAYLLDQGIDVNLPGPVWERVPLAVACDQNHLGLVEMLLDRGAEVNSRDERGSTPLMIAAMRGFPRIVDRLLRSDADPALTDQDGKTALDLAGGIRPVQVRARLTRHLAPGHREG
jgi:ankyrin repeat protein